MQLWVQFLQNVFLLEFRHAIIIRGFSPGLLHFSGINSVRDKRCNRNCNHQKINSENKIVACNHFDDKGNLQTRREAGFLPRACCLLNAKNLLILQIGHKSEKGPPPPSQKCPSGSSLEWCRWPKMPHHEGCGFFAYSWKLPAYSGVLFLLTVDSFRFFTYSWSFFTYSFSPFYLQLELFAYSGKVRLIRALGDCKQRNLTVSKKNSSCKL